MNLYRGPLVGFYFDEVAGLYYRSQGGERRPEREAAQVCKHKGPSIYRSLRRRETSIRNPWDHLARKWTSLHMGAKLGKEWSKRYEEQVCIRVNANGYFYLGGWRCFRVGERVPDTFFTGSCVHSSEWFDSGFSDFHAFALRVDSMQRVDVKRATDESPLWQVSWPSADRPVTAMCGVHNAVGPPLLALGTGVRDPRVLVYDLQTGGWRGRERKAGIRSEILRIAASGTLFFLGMRNGQLVIFDSRSSGIVGTVQLAASVVDTLPGQGSQVFIGITDPHNTPGFRSRWYKGDEQLFSLDLRNPTRGPSAIFHGHRNSYSPYRCWYSDHETAAPNNFEVSLLMCGGDNNVINVWDTRYSQNEPLFTHQCGSATECVGVTRGCLWYASRHHLTTRELPS
mmetsp:Transcript_2790/g.8475  ORF Transcript_2790/g.8475 Transcript_2790/m.8475 type:complete len:397 (+) Transcript_2790:45-1235(+)